MTITYHPDMVQVVTEPGIYPALSAEYQSRRLTPTRPLSYSGIKILLEKTPLDFVSPPKQKTKALTMGQIVHKIALGKGEQFEVSPYDDYRTKDAKAWRDDCLGNGIIPIKQDEYDEAKSCADVVIERIKTALDGAAYQTEVPMFWKEGDTWFSAMMDVWCEELGIVIDPKTTSAIHQFEREISKWGYHIQSALYRRGLDALRPSNAGRHQFKLLPVSTSAPYLTRLISISEGWRTGAEMDIEYAKGIFEDCMATGVWPGYANEEIMDEPSWQMKLRIDREMEEIENE